jgi:hypothetical protein
MNRTAGGNPVQAAYSKLSAATKRELDRLVAQLQKNPSARPTLSRRIKPGLVLVRAWKRKSHRVTVLANGFEYDARPYQIPEHRDSMPKQEAREWRALAPLHWR